MPTSEIELGMFIHKLEGSWFKHPFWKSRFLLTDTETLDTLLASAVPSVVIDTDKGMDQRRQLRELQDEMASARPAGTNGARGAAPARGPRAAMPTPSPHREAVGPATIVKEFGRVRSAVARADKIVSRVFLEARLGKAVAAGDVEPVIEDIYASVQRNLHAFNGLMRCQADNKQVYRHALAISALMIALARQLKLSPSDMREAGMAGLLLDIGAGHVVEGDDPTTLHGEELWTGGGPDQHVETGHALLLKSGDIPPRVVEACLCHHEKLDGSGYPNKLAGLEIDLFSRMAAICDLYDHFVSGDQKRTGLDPAEAIRRLDAMGNALDRDILRAFIDSVGVYPVGSFVRLRSERLAMVVDEDPEDNARPTVRTFYSMILEKRIRSETIPLAQCFGEDEIVGIASLARLGIGDEAQLRASILSAFTREFTA